MKNYFKNIVVEALAIVLPELEERLLNVLLPKLEKLLEQAVKEKVIPVINEKVNKITTK